MVHVIQPNPAIATGTPKEFGDTLKSGDPITYNGNKVGEICH
jgi:2-keto-4-pentenoate hydratase/2-oxohepta-3-ene-1,7-dioic acid hydratase in catechol pathway